MSKKTMDELADEREKELKRRLKICRKAVKDGRGLKSAADEIGVSAPGLFKYLDQNGHSDLRVQLGDQSRIAQSLSIDDCIERLEILIETGSQAETARRVGISRSAMCKWLKQQAYDNYEEDLAFLKEMRDEAE